MKSSILKIIASIIALWILLTFAIYFFALALTDYIEMPDVQMSNTTQECVRVVYPNGRITECSLMPEKYHTVWVQ